MILRGVAPGDPTCPSPSKAVPSPFRDPALFFNRLRRFDRPETSTGLRRPGGRGSDSRPSLTVSLLRRLRCALIAIIDASAVAQTAWRYPDITLMRLRPLLRDQQRVP